MPRRRQVDYMLSTGDLLEVESTNNDMIAEEIINLRKKSNLTQTELSELTGIYQAEISKIERGIGNPSLLTLERIAKGLGAKVEIHIKAVEKSYNKL